MFIDQLSWRHCRRCRRTTRHGRERFVRPAGRPTIRQRIEIWLEDLGRPWECFEHPRPSQSPPPRGPFRTEYLP